MTATAAFVFLAAWYVGVVVLRKKMSSTTLKVLVVFLYSLILWALFDAMVGGPNV